MESLFEPVRFLVGSPSGHEHYGSLSEKQGRTEGNKYRHLSGTMSTPHADRFGFVALHESRMAVKV